MLYDALSQYNKKAVIPMHMPGHKRNAEMLGDTLPYCIDITEIDGFDNLHNAQGILKETANVAARLYGSERTFLLVNGSTGGILAGIFAVTKRGDTVIMARNCHKSVYNAVLINGLKPVYLTPETDGESGIFGSITPGQVEEAIAKNPGARLVIITSPTYEGVVSDITGICQAAHRHDIPVFVDSAHGAHLGFSDIFPDGAIACNADIVIMSLHKTLPALTQCALAHINSSRVNGERFANALAIFETSSLSYVLLSSIDKCVRLLSEEKEQLFDAYAANLKAFDARVEHLKNLKVIGHGSDVLSNHPEFYGFDPGKIIISTRGTNLAGISLIKLLRLNYSIELEMAAPDYALAMTSICDTPQALEELADALLEIDNLTELQTGIVRSPTTQALPRQVLPPYDASEREGCFIPLDEAASMMTLEYVWAYPPGIPMLVPGEILDNATLRLIQNTLASGIWLHSTRGRLPSSLFCVQPPHQVPAE